MIHFQKHISLLFLLSLLSGCYTPPKQYNFSNRSTINNTYDKTWSKVIEYFASNNIPIKNVAKDSGIISAEKIQFPDSYADCGTGLGRIISKTGTFNVFVSQEEGIQKVMVNSDFNLSYQSEWDGSINQVKCNSTGKIEAEILSYINSGS